VLTHEVGDQNSTEPRRDAGSQSGRIACLVGMTRPCILAWICLAACSAGKPGATAPDAAQLDASIPTDTPAGVDLSCVGHSLPVTAPDPLPIGGKVFAIDHYQVMPAAGVTVEVRRLSDDEALATLTSDGDGAFATSLSTSGAPLAAYFAFTAAGDLPSRAVPGDPLVGGEKILSLVASDAELARWAVDAGVSRAPNDGALIAVGVDCASQPLPGGALIVDPHPAALTYYDPTAMRWDPALSTGGNGIALVSGGASPLTISAQLGSTTLASHELANPGHVLTVAEITPR